MRRGGVAAVSEVGVLGDPTTATAAEGERIFAEMVDGVFAPDRPLGARTRRDADMTGAAVAGRVRRAGRSPGRVLGEGSALLGGSPTRLLRLAPAAQDHARRMAG